MLINRIRIENFRSIRKLEMDLGNSTVLIGPNNAGKTAILDAIRIVLTRRWGQRGTGFTENDVHQSNQGDDPKTLPPVKIVLIMEESHKGEWHEDMVAALEDIIVVHPNEHNMLTVQVTCAWSDENDAFEPIWQFLNAEGELLPERRRSINLLNFFSYVPLFWLGPLRDASNEFTPRSGHWGNLLRSVRIPAELEAEAMDILADLDARIIAADPKLAKIAGMIGQATEVAIGESPGSARLNTLPLGIEEMLQRTGLVLRNEDFRPWLPIGHHGQGLQSLAVIFLFQAAVMQQLEEADQPGAEAVFAIEEPEVHLHPQAARTLWEHVEKLSGQKIMTTHSPYFVQHVPLRDLRLIRLQNGSTSFSSIPSHIVSDLPLNDKVRTFVENSGKDVFSYCDASSRVVARSWFDESMSKQLLQCYRSPPDSFDVHASIEAFRHESRILPTVEEEEQLSFHGRRIRGEVFFARRWLLVEGVTEYLLVHALGRAFEWPLDTHGVAVIDFKLSGNAGIYPTLADGLGIPWDMIVDGDDESAKFKKEIIKRGFNEDDLVSKFATLDSPNGLEEQLIQDGHGGLLREILSEIRGPAALDLSTEELLRRLKNGKPSYMNALSMRVANDSNLAQQMPSPFVSYIMRLKGEDE